MVMATFTVTPISATFHRLQPPSLSQFTTQISPHQLGLSGLTSRKDRRSLVVTRGGPPGATTYLFAFIFPLSLLAVTIFTSIKISDKLDKDFYEEMEVNQSILEAEDGDGEVLAMVTDEEPPRSRTRNRPKREVEVSGRTRSSRRTHNLLKKMNFFSPKNPSLEDRQKTMIRQFNCLT